MNRTCLSQTLVWLPLGVIAVLASVAPKVVHAAEPPGLPPLAHYWAGDGTAEDLAGFADGAPEAGVTAPSYVDGRFGQAFQFTSLPRGTRTSAQLAFGNDAGNLGGGDFTVAFWARTTATNILMPLLSKWPFCGHANFWQLTLNSDGSVYGEMEGDDGKAGAGYVSIGNTNRINDNDWHHIALIRADTNVVIYIDGVAGPEKVQSPARNLSNATPLLAGMSPCVNASLGIGYDVRRLEGLLDEIKIYPSALSLTQLAASAGVADFPTAKPVLRIQGLTNEVRVSWPIKSPAGLVLEKNGPALLPSGWLPVAIIPSQQGDENVVLVGPLEWVAYFRLHKPD